MPIVSEATETPAPAAGGSRSAAPKRRRRWRAAALAAALVLAFDLSRDPGRQWSALSLLVAIDVYQATLSPLLPGAGVQCRFVPTCSHYAEASIRRHGALVGSGRAAWRVVRCGPWTPIGTHDPP